MIPNHIEQEIKTLLVKVDIPPIKANIELVYDEYKKDKDSRSLVMIIDDNYNNFDFGI